MLKRFSGLIIIGFICAALSSCKDKDDTYTFDYAYDYYPTDSGHYVIYDVDSILYTFNGNHNNDTVHYQLMELITDTFYDNENELAHRLELFRRADSTKPWSIDRVWYVKRNQTSLHKVEDDLKFTKLVFPPAEGAEWNGNQFLPTSSPYENFRDWFYSYSNVNKPHSVNAFNFDSTLTVNEVDEENLITKKLRKEIYAKGVGMIYQEWEILAKQDVQDNWETGAETGFKIRMRIAGHN